MDLISELDLHMGFLQCAALPLNPTSGLARSSEDHDILVRAPFDGISRVARSSGGHDALVANDARGQHELMDAPDCRQVPMPFRLLPCTEGFDECWDRLQSLFRKIADFRRLLLYVIDFIEATIVLTSRLDFQHEKDDTVLLQLLAVVREFETTRESFSQIIVVIQATTAQCDALESHHAERIEILSSLINWEEICEVTRGSLDRITSLLQDIWAMMEDRRLDLHDDSSSSSTPPAGDDAPAARRRKRNINGSKKKWRRKQKLRAQRDVACL